MKETSLSSALGDLGVEERGAYKESGIRFARDFKKKKKLISFRTWKKKIKSSFSYLSGIYIPRTEGLLLPSPAAGLRANRV